MAKHDSSHFWIILYSCIICSSVSSIKIVLMPIYGYSHHKSTAVIGQELSSRGHSVTMLQWGVTKVFSNISSRDVRSTLSLRDFTKHNYREEMMYSSLIGLMDNMARYCLDVINDGDIMKLLQQSDLIIGEIYMYCPLYIAEYLKKPLVGLHHLNLNALNYPLGVYAPSTPLFGSFLSNQLTLMETMSYYFQYLFIDPYVNFKYNQGFTQVRKRLNIWEHGNELMKRCQLIIVSHNPLVEYPQPLPPHVVAVGIWTLEPPKSLPTLIDNFTSSAKSGFVLVSFGTLFSTTDYGNLPIEIILNLFRKLPYGFLLKASVNLKNVPSNVLVLKDIPQKDVLNHYNLKLFITHAGIASLRESCYHGVPVLVIPKYFDQKDNGVLLTKRLGMGEMVDYKPMDVDEWFGLIPKIINDEGYRSNALRCSRALKSRDHTYSSRLAADHIESFISLGFNTIRIRPDDRDTDTGQQCDAFTIIALGIISREKEKQLRLEQNRIQSIMAEQHYNKTLLRKYGFEPWKRLIQISQLNIQISDKYRNGLLLRVVFCEWRNYTIHSNSEKRIMADRCYDRILVKRSFRSWLKCRFHLQALNKIARNHSLKRILKRAFNAWQDYVTDERILMWAKESTADEGNQRRMLKNGFQSWMQFVKFEKEERIREVRRNNLRKKVQTWLPDYKGGRHDVDVSND